MKKITKKIAGIALTASLALTVGVGVYKVCDTYEGATATANAFRILFASPQTKTASADSVVTTWAENLYVDSIENYTRYRINTSELLWTSYNSTSYADEHLANTKLNGKTVKELNEAEKAKGGKDQIWACLQPAGTFSFYSVCVPNSFSELLTEDIYSVSIEAGWTNADSGTGNTYTNAAAVRYNNRDGDWRLNSGVYTDINSGSTFSIVNQGGASTGSICYLLQTANTLWKNGSVLKMNNPLLNSIYINGKSVDDWNEEAKAALNAGEITDILYGSTNNQNVSAGAPIAVLPGYAEGKIGSFLQIYISTGFLPENATNSIELKEDFEYMFTGSRDTYYTSESVLFNRLGASWKQVTDFVDLDSGEMYLIDQHESTTGVNCFLIGFGGTQKYTNYYCINDNHQAVSALTGQTYGMNLDNITINGKTIGQIKAENPSYDYSTSTHPNIKNGGLYTPIFGHLASGDSNGDGVTDNFIQIYVPTDLIDPSTITEIGLKSSLFNYSGTTKYGLTEDITFVKLSNGWTDTRKAVMPEDITISEATVAGDASELYRVDITSAKWNSTCAVYDYNYGGSVSLRQNLLINGKSVHEINTTVDDSKYVYSTHPMTLSDTYTYNEQTYDLFANPVLVKGEGDTLTLFIHKNYMESLSGEVTVTVKEGMQHLNLPVTGTASKVVATLRTVTFLNDDGSTFTTQNVMYGENATAPASEPTKADDDNYYYDFAGWVIVGTETEFSFDTAIQGDIEIEAKYTAVAKRTVTFKVEDEEYTVSVKDGNVVAAPDTDPTKEATVSHTYAFSGWYNGANAWNFETDKVTANITLTAVFTETEKAKFTVMFDADNGTTTRTDVYDGATVAKPETDPTKGSEEGKSYTFLFWSLDGTTEYDFATPVTATITLKAIYSNKAVYTVTIGENVYNYEEGSKIKNPEDPIKEKDEKYTYTFDAWYYNDKAWDFDNDVVESNMALVAKYNETKVEYSFYVRNYNPMVDVTDPTATLFVKAAWGEAIEIAEVGEYEGVTFLGYQDSEGNEVDLPATMPVGGGEIFATWEFSVYTVTVIDLDGEETVYTFGVKVDSLNGIEYTVEFIGEAVELPELSEAENGYMNVWSAKLPETWELKNYTFTATKTAIVYTITFECEVAEVEPITFTIETYDSIELPAVPEKEGYTGKWDKTADQLKIADAKLKAIYTKNAVVDNSSTGSEDVDSDDSNDSNEAPSVLDQIKDKVPQGIKDIVPQPVKDAINGCAGVVGGIAGGVAALGVAVVALLKKKDD